MPEEEIEKEPVYYYSKGNRVKLKEATQYCAVDDEILDRILADAKTDAESTDAIIAHAKHLYIIDKSKLAVAQLNQLLDNEVVQPVFEHENSLLVFLPEVRIEESRKTKRTELLSHLETEKNEIINDEKRNRTTISAGSGIEALHIANELQESVEPEMVQARMMRVQTKRK